MVYFRRGQIRRTSITVCSVTNSFEYSERALPIIKFSITFEFVINSSHHHHWAAVVSRGLANASAACLLHVSMSCVVLCQIVSLWTVLVQVVSRLLGWSPVSSFLVVWSPSGDTRGPSVVFEAVDMPCPESFHFSYIADYIYAPDVGVSILVCDVEHTSFHFGLCGRKFVLCLFCQCPCLCTICHSWQYT